MRLLLLIFVGLGSHAGEVIDLGRLEVTGTARGPHIEIVDAGHLGETILARFSHWKLKQLEEMLLKVPLTLQPGEIK